MCDTSGMDVLIIEDDAVLRRSFARALRPKSERVREAGGVNEAMQCLDQGIPDIVILDVNLPDGDGVALARTIAALRPMPMTLAVSGQASAAQAFQLKELGVSHYLAKPFSLDEFMSAVDKLLAYTPDVVPHLLPLAGKQGLREVHTQVRRNLLEQALSRSKGNKTKAAELLGVTRQAVQQMMHEFELDAERFK